MDRLRIIIVGCILAGVNCNKINNRIIGGKTVDIKDYPYQVGVIANGYLICGGSIISEDSLLSAAHCFAKPNALSFKIRAGSSFASSGGRIFSIKEIVSHESYNPDVSFDWDIAFVRVEGSFFSEGSVAAPIALPYVNQVFAAGILANVSGWGLTEPFRRTSEQLRAVEVPIFNHEECKKHYVELTAGMICAGYAEGGKGSCHSDSGGPMVVDNILVGIVSFGKLGCVFTPGVYANVAAFREWIKKTSGV